LMSDEKVTVAGGVPTIWLGILALIDSDPKKYDLSHIRTMVIGGSAAPAAMIDGFKKRHGIDITHAWGMTEMSPLGTVANVKRAVAAAGDEASWAARASQGYPAPFVDIRNRGEDGLLPWDGEAMGELEVRGPWVARAYHRGQGAEKFTDDGWFVTGDVVTIDAGGNLKICDRSKDLVKSGGEWISSVDLENLLMAHPAVAEAAVIAIPDDRWGERPLAAVVLRDGASAEPDELREHLAGEYAKWQLPDRFEFVDEIPRTATGKFKKTVLREMFVSATETTKA
jgi:fatty-acyl-CoA synthase